MFNGKIKTVSICYIDFSLLNENQNIEIDYNPLFIFILILYFLLTVYWNSIDF